MTEIKVELTSDYPMNIDEESTVAVVLIGGLPVTRKMLVDAFEKVEDKTDWKNPVDSRVGLATEWHKKLMLVAVEFFTGTKPNLEPLGNGFYVISADGYYSTEIKK
jgi:hypothetical protein